MCGVGDFADGPEADNHEDGHGNEGDAVADWARVYHECSYESPGQGAGKGSEAFGECVEAKGMG